MKLRQVSNLTQLIYIITKKLEKVASSFKPYPLHSIKFGFVLSFRRKPRRKRFLTEGQKAKGHRLYPR
jgi:hypothetical protein